MKRSLLIALAISLLASSGFRHSLTQQPDMLVVFTQPGNAHFAETTLPKLRKLAEEKGLEMLERDAADGVPAEITATPAIVYQSSRGRSVYSSRYAEFSTLTNFIRTSRVVPQRVATFEKEEVLVWQNGRCKIVAPVKVTEVQGEPSDEFDREGFEQNVRMAFSEAMEHFSLTEKVLLQRTDRQFYLDVHPYITAGDQVFLSLEIYSQYSCIDPVFSNFSQPITGIFQELDELLAQTAQVLEGEIIRQMESSEIGDAFVPIGAEVAGKNWEELGLALPEQVAQQQYSFSEMPELPATWTFAGSIDPEIPLVQFRFMAPLDRYIGEIRAMEGEISTEQGISGAFTADMSSLTMGMESFDAKVLKDYVKAKRYPTSTFLFKSLQTNVSLTFGQTQTVEVEGEFQVMRKKNPVAVVAQLTPTLDAEGNPLLQVNATFSLNIVDDFNIKGPDGPDPARKMMEFDLNFFMKPEAGK